MKPQRLNDNPEVQRTAAPPEVERPPRLPRWLTWTREHQNAKALSAGRAA